MLRIDSKSTRYLNKIKIDDYDLERLGLYLKKDYIYTYVISKEVEEKWITGRDMPYYKIKRKLPIDIEIEFNIKESIDFNGRYKRIEKFLESAKEKILTINEEDSGFKIYFTEITNIQRGIGNDKITIKFRCYPDIYNLDGSILVK
nr:MAG TPA: distal tail protein [Caudoviricetes sp.]